MNARIVRQMYLERPYLKLQVFTNEGFVKAVRMLDMEVAQKEVDYLIENDDGEITNSWGTRGKWIGEALNLAEDFYNFAGRMGDLVFTVVSKGNEFKLGHSITTNLHGRFQKPRAGKPTTKRDFQRKKVYGWEWDLDIESKKLNEKECQDLVNKMYRWFMTGNMKGETRIAPPKVFFNRRGDKSYARYATNEIKIQTDWAMHSEILAHEVAHIVTGGDEQDGGHGKLFVRHFLELLVKFCKLNLKELETSAKKAKIKIAPRTHSKRVKRS